MRLYFPILCSLLLESTAPFDHFGLICNVIHHILVVLFKVGDLLAQNSHFSTHEKLMSHVTMMALISFWALFTFSCGGNRNQQGVCVTLMWKAALSRAVSAL